MIKAIAKMNVKKESQKLTILQKHLIKINKK